MSRHGGDPAHPRETGQGSPRYRGFGHPPPGAGRPEGRCGGDVEGSTAVSAGPHNIDDRHTRIDSHRGLPYGLHQTGHLLHTLTLDRQSHQQDGDLGRGSCTRHYLRHRLAGLCAGEVGALHELVENFGPRLGYAIVAQSPDLRPRPGQVVTVEVWSSPSPGWFARCPSGGRSDRAWNGADPIRTPPPGWLPTPLTRRSTARSSTSIGSTSPPRSTPS